MVHIILIVAQQYLRREVVAEEYSPAQAVLVDLLLVLAIPRKVVAKAAVLAAEVVGLLMAVVERVDHPITQAQEEMFIEAAAAVDGAQVVDRLITEAKVLAVKQLR
jgi:hypothetical protein